MRKFFPINTVRIHRLSLYVDQLLGESHAGSFPLPLCQFLALCPQPRTHSHTSHAHRHSHAHICHAHTSHSHLPSTHTHTYYTHTHLHTSHTHSHISHTHMSFTYRRHNLPPKPFIRDVPHVTTLRQGVNTDVTALLVYSSYSDFLSCPQNVIQSSSALQFSPAPN